MREKQEDMDRERMRAIVRGFIDAEAAHKDVDIEEEDGDEGKEL